MATGQRLLPIRLELDLANEYMTADCARYIKNLSFFRGDTSEVTDNKSSAGGKYKPLESSTIFDPNFVLPEGYNHFIGAYPSKEENLILFHYYNDQGNHTLYIINGETQNIRLVYSGLCLNYQLNPEHFIHEGGAYLEIFKYNDPITGESKKRSYYNYTDGFNDMRFICIEDAIATNGFDPSIWPYFNNPHPKCLLINAGLADPEGCVTVAEIPNDNTALQNNLRFNTWQFMVRFIDVYGRPSEWGDMSDLYVPGTNDCIGSSDFLPRCIDLSFDAGNALVNIIEVAFRNCNDPQWYRDTSLFLYEGTNLGEWWTRSRNSEIPFNPETNTITYRFCKDKECDPIPQEETNRTQNPLPRVTQSVAKIGKFLGVGKNLHGFQPFGSSVMDQISLEITPPELEPVPPVRSAEIFVPIWNTYIGTQQPVYELQAGQWVWGGRKDFSDDYVNGIISEYKMNFGDLNRNGFIGYLAGTGIPPASTISELYYVNDANVMTKVEDFSIIHQPSGSTGINPVTDQPIYYYKRKYFLKFTFNNVAPAKYIFRIAAHTAKLGDQNFYNTSTYVKGQFSWAGKSVNFSNQVANTKELLVDLCESNYDSLNDNKVLVIWDMTEPRNEGTSRSKIIAGYIYETKVDDVFTTPIELLNTDTQGDDRRNGEGTDHNGFYFGAVRRDDHMNMYVYGFCSCVYKTLRHWEINSNDNRLFEETFDLKTVADSGCVSYADNPCNRILITGKVTECDSGMGIPGVGVVLSRGRYTVTNESGEYTIIAHDDCLAGDRVRRDKLYYTPTTCNFTGCDEICVQSFDVVIVPCVTCIERGIVASDRQIDFKIFRGLLSGGNYGVALWGEDWLGREGFAQTKDSLYFNAPTLIQTKTFAPSEFKLIIPPSVTLPLWITELKIGITKELSMAGDYITWIVDDVKFIDNTGQENNIAPTQIKIYYGSLNEYNVQNNFNTTTGWQFIVQDENGVQSNYTSDYVEFYINGDGTFFPKLTRALIKYDQAGQYFLINYDTALKDLKKFAQIRLGRPQNCATKGVFYQICKKIKVINGKVQGSEFILNAFDTYYKYRQIPIPIGTEEEPENTLRSFGFPFEHHSPSDFWGDHCINIGKVNTRNPYEAEIIKENEIMLSGAISVNGQLNFLNYFDDAQAVPFDTWNFGGIVSILPFIAGVRVICQYNAFTVGYNDNVVRVNEAGQIVVPSAADRFGKPDVKIGNNYGCSFFDKNTIRQKDGWIQYLDSREGALIQDNYNDSVIVSKIDLSKGIIGGVNSWLLPKIKYIQEWNRTHENKKYFHGTINPASRSYLLTDITIQSSDYVNGERGVKVEKHETLEFDYLNKFFRQFISYTPQGYSYLEGQKNDIQLFAFTNKAYSLYSTSPIKTYNTFFGITVNRVIRIVVALDAFQKKQFKTITIVGKHLYFADQVITDSNQISRILKAAFRQGDFYWGAPILPDLLTPNDPNYPTRPENNIFDGNMMYGSVIDIRLIGNPEDDTTYTELLGIIVDGVPEGKVLG